MSAIQLQPQGSAYAVPANGPVEAMHALRQSPIPALRLLQVEESDARIVISGRVACYYHKQMAQETLMPVLGQRELVNRVAVVRD